MTLNHGKSGSTPTEVTKQCSICRLRKPIDAFHKQAKALDGLQCRCKTCSSKQRGEYYKKQNKNERAYDTKRKLEIKAKIDSLKAKPCMDCGGNFPPCAMDFDHLRDKEVCISTAVRNGRNFENILKEIEKCELVCACCHRIRTHARKLAHSSNG